MLGYKDYSDKFAFNIEYTIPSIDLLLGYNLIYFNSKDVVPANSVSGEKIKFPSFAVSDLYVTYAPSHGKLAGLEINAGIYNLFNRAYASHTQRMGVYNDPNVDTIDWELGRNFKITISYKF